MSNEKPGCRYLLIDLYTGMMDGMYFDREVAEIARRSLNEEYEGSIFCIFERLSDPGHFDGLFPPNHLFHADLPKGRRLPTEKIL